MWAALGDVAVFGWALDAGEVAEHCTAMAAGDDAANGAVVSGDAPLSYWRLDDAGAPVAVDEVGANPGPRQGRPSFGEAGVDVVA